MSTVAVICLMQWPNDCVLVQWIVLTTNSWVGGHNNALGGIMVTVGSLAFITAIIFFCSYHLNKKRRVYADPNYLSWNRTSLVH